MRHYPGIPVIACLAAGLLLHAPGLAAADSGQISREQARLEAVRERIGSLKRELEAVRGEYDSGLAALEKTDRAIGRITAEVRELDAREAAVRSELARLEDERDSVRERLDRMRAVLARELQTAYRNGRQERIRLLLNQDDPARIGRMLTYQGYFTRARNRRMDEFHAALDELHATEQGMVEQQQQLAAVRADKERQAGALRTEKSRQAELLEQLGARLSSGKAELATLEADEARINQLLETLRQALRDIPVDSGREPLAKLKGKLAWPVPGKIDMRYGARQAAGKMRARGVHIATAAGTDVRAIARGRVVFADWLRGFGLLLILDHGDGYMSLYGENSSLYKGVGEWVGRGEVIAAAGNSGGQLRTGVYLELRKDGRPLDPGGWFRGQPDAPRNARAAAG
jgi:septal ring factor EnvC (AmiA/AmiB activator)